MSRFLSPALSAVTPYTPGEQPQDQQYIKLNTNESPYLPSPRVVAAVSEAEVEKLRLYSDPACAQLLRTAAAHFGLQPSQVMPGNGSDENLFFALRAFCDENHPLAFADITYGCYGVWCSLLHIPTHIIPLKEDFTLDPADYHGLHETIVIANPNAPTGLCLPRDAIEGILRSNPDSVVIVDEAYVDFGGESCVPLIDQYENLLVVQTFSKSRQLAGARLGLAMGNAALIADLNRVKFSLNPYNINRLTLKAGQAALEDTVYFDYDLHEENAGTYEETIAGLNCVIWSNDYQPRIEKEQVQGKNTEEIAKILFKDWMNSFHEWGNNSFIVTDFENVKILGMETAADNPVAGYTKEELTEPEAKKTYVFGAACGYTYIGIGPEAFGSLAAGGGQAFGNDGVKIEASESFINTTNGFVLTEWEDSYSMDTISNCKKKFGK